MKISNSLKDEQRLVSAAKTLLCVNLRLPPHHNSVERFIYSLTDPTNDEIRYVGQTGDLKRRYAGHLYDKRGTDKKIEWIASLRSQKLKPEMKILEELDDKKKARERERRWIFHIVQQGSILFQREFFVNPYLMKEISFIKNANFLTAEFTESFWQRLAVADNSDGKLTREVMKRVVKENGRLDTVKFLEEVREEYEKRTGDISFIIT